MILNTNINLILNKMKRVSLFLVAMCIMLSATVAQVSVWDGSHSTWTQGTGTETNPYIIENAAQLAYLAVYINGGGTSSGQYWKLIIDIDLNGLQWTPIGSGNYFRGHFDGGGHTIANLVVNVETYAGLFGYMSGGGISNVGIIGNSSINSSFYAGGIVGRASSGTIINNCYNTGSVSAFSNSHSTAGGIVGYVDGDGITINNCYNTGSVSAFSPASYYDYYSRAGGIVGAGSSLAINNCYNTGNVSASVTNNYSYAGGIVGPASGLIKNCYNTGNISAPYYSSGISHGGNVNNSYYLDTSTTNPGGGIPKTAAFMKTSEFVDLLNNGPTPNFAYKLDHLLVNDGYPVHSDFKLQTLSPTNIAKTTVTLNATIDFGTATITQQGFLLNNNGAEETIYANISGNNIAHDISDLIANTTYQYKVFAAANGSTYWGEQVEFTTLPFNQSGTAFLIETREDLIRLANYVNGGNSYSGQEFILANNITLPVNTPNNILSIGTKVTGTPFSGIFNGNGKRIENVYIDEPNTPYQGLFGYTKDAEIRKLRLENITASGRDYTGGIVGWAENTKLDSLFVKGGTLHSLSYCGGLIGYQTPGTKSIITACRNLNCTVKGNSYVGGLLGYSDQGTVRNSYVAADVSGQGNAIGAIIGGAWKVLSYNCRYNKEYDCPNLAIGENLFKSGEEEDGMTSAEMRSPDFVAFLNQGLTKPAWKMDYNQPINNGFPILIWETDGTTAIEENPVNSTIKIYPNPTRGEIQVTSLVPTTEESQLQVTSIEMFDVFGRNVDVKFPSFGGVRGGNIAHLPAGIYFIRIQTENGAVTRKVVKQ